MSHFVTLVIVPANTREVEQEVERLLAPYNEHAEVPEYDRECSCISQVAERAGREAATEKFGPVDAMREQFARDYPQFARDVSAEAEAAWREFTAPRWAYEAEVARAHPMWGKPDPACGFYTAEYCPEGRTPGERFEDGSGCGGTGTYRSTYNPKSKWDWYRIGGRWDGYLFGPETEKKRQSDGGFNWGAAHTELQWNARLIRDVPWDQQEYVPFAIVTPDGEWHQKGRMGWWGIVSAEKEQWPDEARGILRDYPDHLGVAVDCHI